MGRLRKWVSSFFRRQVMEHKYFRMMSRARKINYTIHAPSRKEHK